VPLNSSAMYSWSSVRPGAQPLLVPGKAVRSVGLEPHLSLCRGTLTPGFQARHDVKAMVLAECREKRFVGGKRAGVHNCGL